MIDIQPLLNLNIRKIHSVFSMYTEENSPPKQTKRSSWGLILKYEGETVYTHKGKTHISNLENMVILPKGANYVWHCEKAGSCYIIDFDCDESYDEIWALPIADCHEKILSLFKSSEYKHNAKRGISNLEVLKNAYSILLLALQSSVQSQTQAYIPKDKQAKIAPALDYILKHYTQSIKNEDLAARTGLSTVYFRKLFTALVGVSPITYIHSLRIKKAKEMLKSDYGSLSEIAYSLGYSDIYEFSKTFKRHVGIPPSHYAKQEPKLSQDKK